MPLALCLAITLACAGDRPDVVVNDFEASSYGTWTVTGKAFGSGPASGALPGQMAVGDFQGNRLVNTFFEGDDTEGTLTSPEFTIDRAYMKFLIGGGRHPRETCMNLLVDGQVVQTASGHASEFLREASWDLSKYAGKTARIEIVDHRKGSWGHVLVDQIVLSDTRPEPVDERASLLKRAEQSIQTAAAKVANDPNRPSFHILPPANWLNDPNGPIYIKGYYHMFFQHNPYGDGWGNMHWAHVRSKDLAHWERLPIALWPSKLDGEEHVFSGSATVNPKGELMLFYTSIGGRLPEQWAAVPDSDDLTLWKKHPANPILTEELHGSTKVHEWRDPFVFRADGKTFMVLGGNLNGGKGGKGSVMVYRAENDELTRWTYLGVLFTHPDANVSNVECPLFFPLGGKWVLITSQGRPVHWFVGDLDLKTMTFTADHRGFADTGNFYAPNVTTGDHGQTLLWGWVPDFPKDRGWNGCLTLPRVVTIAKNGGLAFAPAPELQTLRGAETKVEAQDLNDEAKVLPDVAGDALEIHATLDPGTSKTCGFKVRRSADGQSSVPITFDGTSLDVQGTRLEIREKGPLDLRIFVDHSVVEVYTGTGQCLTKVIAADPPNQGVEAFATGGKARISQIQSWPMSTIWKASKP